MKHSLSEQGIRVIKVNFGEILIKGKGILGPFIREKIRRELYHLYEHVLCNKTHLS